MGELITKGELARKAQVSPSAVSKALSRTDLKKALIGRKLDSDHVEVTRFLKRQLDKRRGKLEEKEYPHRTSSSRHNPAVPTEDEIMATRRMLSEDIRRLEKMPFSEVVQAFGTDKALADFLKALKTIEEIAEKRTKNAELEGMLVSRSLVQSGIIDRINSAHTRLLTDGAKSIASELYSMVKIGKTEDDCEVFARQQITRFLKPLKPKMNKTIETTDKSKDD